MSRRPDISGRPVTPERPMTFSPSRDSARTSGDVRVSGATLCHICGGAALCYTVEMLAECNDAACKKTLLIFYMKQEKILKERADIGWKLFCRNKCTQADYDAWLMLQAAYEQGRRLKYQCSAILEQTNKKRGIKWK